MTSLLNNELEFPRGETFAIESATTSSRTEVLCLCRRIPGRGTYEQKARLNEKQRIARRRVCPASKWFIVTFTMNATRDQPRGERKEGARRTKEEKACSARFGPRTSRGAEIVDVYRRRRKINIKGADAMRRREKMQKETQARGTRLP